MARNTRGRKKPAQAQRNKMYEWHSPSLRTASDICLGGCVVVILAVLLLAKDFALSMKIFCLDFFLFGLIEVLRGIDNKSANGPKNATIYSFIFAGILFAAGIAFFVFVALPAKG